MVSRIARLFLTLSLGAMLLSGCSNMFFYPSDTRYVTPDQLNLDFEEVLLDSTDGERLYGWWLPAEGDAKGTVYYLHGNAQNISAHIINVSWLPREHYNVFLIDYRGFGYSTGDPDLEGALLDARAGLEWTRKRAGDQPLFVLGQSLGGALAIVTLGQQDAPTTNGLIVDGALSGFRDIAREKLDGSWLTWPFQTPLSWTIPDDYEPVDYIDRIHQPLLVIHSRRDPVVPYHHGVRLYDAASKPKRFIATQTPHAATFIVPEYREAVLDFMAKYAD
ncbi:alpha/beta hydrolase [Marinobacteraceae bacterium S3BR75-40.1]